MAMTTMTMTAVLATTAITVMRTAIPMTTTIATTTTTIWPQ
jgi:hypothetical protein